MLRPAVPAALALAASPCFTHLDPGEHGSFLAGLSHPLFGLDHVLAMIGVGLWGALLGGPSRWALPAAFVGSMVLGFGAALLELGLPFVEPMMAASLFLLGLAVALMIRLPLATAGVLTALFGQFHGHAHGEELGSAVALVFGLGFVVSTATLHASGLGLFAGPAYATATRPGLGHGAGRTGRRHRRLSSHQRPRIERRSSLAAPDRVN